MACQTFFFRGSVSKRPTSSNLVLRWPQSSFAFKAASVAVADAGPRPGRPEGRARQVPRGPGRDSPESRCVRPLTLDAAASGPSSCLSPSREGPCRPRLRSARPCAADSSPRTRPSRTRDSIPRALCRADAPRRGTGQDPRQQTLPTPTRPVPWPGPPGGRPGAGRPDRSRPAPLKLSIR
jgi:hypothetical protein